jgi:hypothetical protein
MLVIAGGRRETLKNKLNKAVKDLHLWFYIKSLRINAEKEIVMSFFFFFLLRKELH